MADHHLKPNGWAFTVLLGAMAGLLPLAIDMGLPALSAIEAALRASPAIAGQTLSLFLAGFALAQLALGPLSDRLGRRPVLLGGLTLYALAGIGCTTAPSAVALVAWRLVQGIGAASSTVLALAIVRDLFEGAAARRKLSVIAVVGGVAPIVAPTLGGFMLLLAGWRGVYGALALSGLALLVAVAVWLGESRRLAPPAGFADAYREVLTDRRAVGFVLCNAASFGCMFAWISGSPLVLMDALGVSAQAYGLLFACTAGAILLGSWLNGWLAGRGVGARRPLAWAIAAQFAATVALVVAMLAGPLSLVTLMPPLVVVTFCRGVIGPTAIHGAMEPMPHLAGVAAAALGCVQMATGATASAAVAWLYPSLGPPAMAAVMLAMATLCAGMGRIAAGGYNAPA